ncbi:MAG: hypothetical protein R2710_22815 [Acidimicrobiales bacterium]
MIAAIDDERRPKWFPSSAVVVRPDGSARYQPDTDNTRRHRRLGDTPTPPRPAALTGQVERLYRAYFGRAPEPPGLLYWRTQRARGLSIDNVSTPSPRPRVHRHLRLGR